MTVGMALASNHSTDYFEFGILTSQHVFAALKPRCGNGREHHSDAFNL
jgi:hypothetical protein